jgi:hypothetical protein
VQGAAGHPGQQGGGQEKNNRNKMESRGVGKAQGVADPPPPKKNTNKKHQQHLIYILLLSGIPWMQILLCTFGAPHQTYLGTPFVVCYV